MKTFLLANVMILISLLPETSSAAANCKEKWITLDNGIKLEYEVCGNKSAPALLMIHGVTDSKHSWSVVAPYLSDQYRVYVPSLRGHGDSDKPDSGYQIPVFAHDMLLFMDKLNIDSASLVGHSLGSLVAHQMASVAPERIEKMVLIGSAPTLCGNEVVASLWDYVIGLDSFADPISEDFIREWQTGPNEIDEEFFEKVISETAKVPARVWKEAFRGLMTDDHSRFLADITAPTLIIWGDADPLISVGEQDRLLSAIPGSVVTIFEGAGHNTHWEQPHNVVDEILTFLQ